MKPCRMLVAASVTAVLLWGGYRAYRAHANLVTLTVRNMDVRRVVSKLEWQTWEHIAVNKRVGGKVTLSVHNVPLDEVLNIIGLQTDSRWLRLYPIYSTKKSIDAFNQVVRGESQPAGSGWSRLQQLASWQQVGLSGFASVLRAENKVVSAQIVNKDLNFTALALSRFSKAQLVPEDSAVGTVNLTLQQVPFDTAVAKVAKQAHRNWKRIYAIQPLNAATVVRQDNSGRPPGGGGRQVIAVPKDSGVTVQVETNQVVAVPPEQPVLAPETALEAIQATMTPEQRQQMQEQIANASQAAGLSPADRQQQMQTPGSPAARAAQAAQEDMQQRIENRLKNGTIEQRLAHDRRVIAQRQAGQKQ